MRKALFGALLTMAAVITAAILIVKKGPIAGTVLVLVLAVLLFVVTVVSELVKRYGKKLPPRDRHP